MNTKIGIILGSGLNGFSEELSSRKIIFEDNSSFHKIKVYSGKSDGIEVIVFSGRKHFYEGYGLPDIFSNVISAKKLGINLLIITNAAGGINPEFNISDIMLITSHFNFIKKRIPVKNKFSVYDKVILNKIQELAMNYNLNLKKGSYCCAPGPTYETKSEIRFFSKIGIDAVGMSTIPEVLFANDSGIKTIALSCITNLISENSTGITNHEEVVEAGKNSYKNFSGLIKLIISHSNEFYK